MVRPLSSLITISPPPIFVITVSSLPYLFTMIDEGIDAILLVVFRDTRLLCFLTSGGSLSFFWPIYGSFGFFFGDDFVSSA